MSTSRRRTPTGRKRRARFATSSATPLLGRGKRSVTRCPTTSTRANLFAFPSHKSYYSVYVMGGRVADHRDALGNLNCGKSCIRFKKLDELPLDVLREIVRDTASANESAASSPS